MLLYPSVIEIITIGSDLKSAISTQVMDFVHGQNIFFPSGFCFIKIKIHVIFTCLLNPEHTFAITDSTENVPFNWYTPSPYFTMIEQILQQTHKGCLSNSVGQPNEIYNHCIPLSFLSRRVTRVSHT